MTSIEETASALVAWAKDAEVEFDVVDVGHLVVTLPGEKKLKTTVSVRFTPQPGRPAGVPHAQAR